MQTKFVTIGVKRQGKLIAMLLPKEQTEQPKKPLRDRLNENKHKKALTKRKEGV